jgi:epothilone synthetase B
LNECEQTLFKLERPGLRADLQNLPAINLDFSGDDSIRRDRYYGRRSVRTFSEQAVTRFQFSELLSCLSGCQSTDSLIPKFLYPSAGNLQPVQCYVHISPGRVEGLTAGTYYYHPERHRLIALSNSDLPLSCHLPHNAVTGEQAAFSIFLIGQMAAIEPIYGELARDFCLLEAGAMTQLLMSEAVNVGLGLCPIGDLDFQAIRHLFRLNETHAFLHCIVGGNPVDNENSRALTRHIGESNGASVRAANGCGSRGTNGTWLAELKEFLAGKLPEHLIPKNFVVLESLPLNRNGKVDRRALMEMSSVQFSNIEIPTEAKAPRTDFEHKLVEIWREILETDEISVEANFGEMGADSIHLVRVLHRIRPLAEREISITDLFKYPNIRTLAEFLKTKPRDELTLAKAERRAALRNELRGRRKG